MSVLMRKNLLSGMIALSILFFTLACFAAGLQYEKVGDYGYIDWLDQKVYAKGVGIAPKDKKNSTQAKALAYRAAVVVAQRNLLEVIKGVHIDSTTVIEKRIVTNEKIVSSIQGLIQFSTVENSKQLAPDTVEVTVSMPLLGKMAEILVQVVEDPAQQERWAGDTDLGNRLNDLEDRIRALEGQVSGLEKISAEKERLLFLFQELVVAWQAYAAEKPLFVNAAYASDAEISGLRNQIIDQEKRMAAFSVLLKDLSSRLSALETGTEITPMGEPEAKPSPSLPYTGLVIDARQTGFKPCLKPKVFGHSELLYPGAYLDLQKAIKSGYVRYYNNKTQAQQSQRAGSLPYVISARATHEGDRSLSVGPESYKILKTIIQSPNNFLADCKVVIVF